MRQAADLEDRSGKHVAMENRFSPIRELFGELLLQANDPAQALKEFERRCETTRIAIARMPARQRPPKGPEIGHRPGATTRSSSRLRPRARWAARLLAAKQYLAGN